MIVWMGVLEYKYVFLFVCIYGVGDSNKVFGIKFLMILFFFKFRLILRINIYLKYVVICV